MKYRSVIRPEAVAGFTLVELISVMVIVSILMAMALPRYGQGAISKMRLDTTSRQLVADIRYARRRAISKGMDYRLQVRRQDQEYCIEREYENNKWEPDPKWETKQISSQIDISASATFRFEPFGNATSSPSVTLQAGSSSHAISVIQATGRVEMG